MDAGAYNIEFEIETPELTAALDADAPELDVELLTEAEAIAVGIKPSAYKGDPGEPGKSPRVGADGCWEVYDNTTGGWLSTGVSASGGVTDYEQLSNKPRINGVELSGDRTSLELDLATPIPNSDIEALFAR